MNFKKIYTYLLIVGSIIVIGAYISVIHGLFSQRKINTVFVIGIFNILVDIFKGVISTYPTEVLLGIILGSFICVWILFFNKIFPHYLLGLFFAGILFFIVYIANFLCGTNIFRTCGSTLPIDSSSNIIILFTYIGGISFFVIAGILQLFYNLLLSIGKKIR